MDETRYRVSATKTNLITDLYCDAEIYNIPAKSFVFEWLGGPPGEHGGFFKASMLALVVDCCMYAMDKGHAERVCNALGMAKNYGEEAHVTVSTG